MKIVNVVPFLALLLTSTVAMADSDDRRAGTKGHVTAYETGSRDVIDVDPCPMRNSVPDYVTCGERFRTKIRTKMCSDKGKGLHRWRYQAGDGPLVPQSVSCR